MSGRSGGLRMGAQQEDPKALHATGALRPRVSCGGRLIYDAAHNVKERGGDIIFGPSFPTALAPEIVVPPQRIVIVGCSGSGKSTLARKLGLRLGLPVLHLDVLHYLPEWKSGSLAEFRARVLEAHRGDAWISEGNFASSTFDIRLPRAQAVIVLERSRWLCLRRVIWRAVMERRDRSDLPLGCPEQLDPDLLRYIWNFERFGKREIEAARLQFGPSIPVLRLSRNRHVAAFLAAAQFPVAQAITDDSVTV